MTILVYGATGFMGRLVARALRDRQVAVAVSGRDRARVQAVASELGAEARPAPAHDPDALAAALRGVEAVVACAGPFAQVGEPVLAAAVRASVPYLDIAAEPRYLRDVYERYDSAARRAGVCAVPGFGLESALGDVACACAAAALRGQRAAGEAAAQGGEPGDGGPEDGERERAPERPPQAGDEEIVDELAVAFAVRDFAPAPGTLAALLDRLTAPGDIWTGDRWEGVVPARDRRWLNFGPGWGQREAFSLPCGEAVTAPRHTPARSVVTYAAPGDRGLAVLARRLARVASPAIPALARRTAIAHARAALARAAAPTPAERARSAFAVLARAVRGFQRAQVVISGADFYASAAHVAAVGVELLAAGGDLPAGVRAPAELAPARDLLAMLVERCGLTVA